MNVQASNVFRACALSQYIRVGVIRPGIVVLQGMALLLQHSNSKINAVGMQHFQKCCIPIFFL